MTQPLSICFNRGDIDLMPSPGKQAVAGRMELVREESWGNLDLRLSLRPWHVC